MSLRVGVVGDPAALPVWVADLLDELRELPVELALVRATRAPLPSGGLAERFDRHVPGPRGVDLAATVPAGDVAVRDTADGLDVVFVPESPAPAGAEAWTWRAVELEDAIDVELLANGEPLDRARIERSPVSPYRNQARVPAKVVELVVRQLRARTLGLEAPAAASAASDPPVGQLGTAEIARELAARQIRWRLMLPRWFIAYRRRGAAELMLLEAAGTDFYADPFPITVGGHDYLFFEHFQRERGYAVIAFVELDAAGRPSAPTTVIERDHHLSYPFVFERDGAVWMIPNTFRSRTIELYRATDFPARWVPERILVDDVRAGDATLVEHDGLLWLLTGVARKGEHSLEDLHAYSAPSLDALWTPHPLNPVVADIRTARPAGSVFRHGESLIRPGQDCARDYGRAIVFNRVEALSPTDYREREVDRLEPTWLPGLTGTHTYSRSERYEAFDAYDVRRRFRRVAGAQTSQTVPAAQELSRGVLAGG
ncbi:MAG TPA: hypothetical protein VHS03_06285 [Gaiellaceae bacterium]|nr:hypothetical protein [Gaiellaceae bacterium]